MESNTNIRVVRVGGSLLTWDHLPSVLNGWLSKQPPASNVLIAGGGPWVELLRQSARRYEIPEPEAHVLCLRALSVTADLLGHLCDCPVARQLSEVRSLVEQHAVIAFDVYRHLEEVDVLRSDPLPKTWDVTSDSIAARVATDLNAEELVVVKSADPPQDASDFRALGELGYVDPYFAIVARGLNVRFVNLRGRSL